MGARAAVSGAISAARAGAAWSTLLRPVLQVLIGAAMLIGVAAFNGRPSAFPDTGWYYSQGRYIAERFGLASKAEIAAAVDDPTAPEAPGDAGVRAKATAAARSPLYGVFIWISWRFTTLWGLVAAQALCAAWLIRAAMVALGLRACAAYLPVMAVLSLTTALPLFAGFAMPDVFAGLTILGLAVLLAGPGRLKRGDFIGVLALTAVSMSLHASHRLDAVLLMAAAALALAVPRLRPLIRPGTPHAAVAVALGFGLSLLAGFAVGALSGGAQGAPPFVTARLLADGPGRIYLRRVCTGEHTPYALCAYRRLRLTDAEDVLWSIDPRAAVFGVADARTRRALQAEQGRFSLAVLVDDPVGEIVAAARNSAAQLMLFRAEEPLRNPADYAAHFWLKRTAITRLVPDMAPCLKRPTACAPRLPYAWLQVEEGTAILLALAFLGWRLSRPDLRSRLVQLDPDDALSRLLAFCAVLLLGVLINAAVCGAISGPFARYEARLVWLVPFAALVLGSLVGLPRGNQGVGRGFKSRPRSQPQKEAPHATRRPEPAGRHRTPEGRSPRRREAVRTVRADARREPEGGDRRTHLPDAEGSYPDRGRDFLSGAEGQDRREGRR